jgi:ethanolamine transporter EutH
MAVSECLLVPVFCHLLKKNSKFFSSGLRVGLVAASAASITMGLSHYIIIVPVSFALLFIVGDLLLVLLLLVVLLFGFAASGVCPRPE